MRRTGIPAFLLSVLVAALAFLPITANAQTSNAAIVGDVTDETGGLVPGAEITVTNLATGVQRSASTNERGAYRVYPVQPGTYDVAASSDGFKTRVMSDIAVAVAATVKVDMALELG